MVRPCLTQIVREARRRGREREGGREKERKREI